MTTANFHKEIPYQRGRGLVVCPNDSLHNERPQMPINSGETIRASPILHTTSLMFGLAGEKFQRYGEIYLVLIRPPVLILYTKADPYTS